MKKVIVIGAGVSGLASAIDLLSKGYEVELFEKQSGPGGKMDQIQSNGFTFDIGPSIVMMPDIYKEVFTKANKRYEDYIEFIRLDPSLTVFFHDEMDYSLDVSCDMSQFIPMLEKINPKDAHGFLRYLENIYGRYLNAKENFILKSFNHPRDFYNLKTLHNAYKLKTFNSASASIEKYVDSKYISQMLAFQTLYIGVSPNNGPSLYTIIPMIEMFYGVYYLKGGMHAMAKAMEKLFLDLNGVIHYNHPVSEILIENKQAVGIIANDQKVMADKIVCSADFPYVMKSLIKDDKDKGKYVDQKIDRMKYSCSTFVMYVETSRKYENAHVHNFVIANAFEENINQIFNGERINDPSFYVYIASKIDESMAPKGQDGLYILIPVAEHSVSQEDWDEHTKAYFKEIVLKKLEKTETFKTIRQDIKHISYMSPDDFSEKYNAYNGACFGLQPILKQSNHLRPQSKALKCEGLYFCGSSNHPGAGVPIAISSAYLATDALIEDDQNA